MTAAAGHDFTYGIHLPPDGGKPAKDFTGVIEDRPATTRVLLRQPRRRPDGGARRWGRRRRATRPARAGSRSTRCTSTDDPAEKIHNVRVDLHGVPPALDLVKQPAADDAIDIDVTTTAGRLRAPRSSSTTARARRGRLPAMPADGGGAVVFTGGDMFFLKARVLHLRRLEPETEARAARRRSTSPSRRTSASTSTPGSGANHQINVNDCDDWEPSEHNPAHVEYHDVFIKDAAARHAVRLRRRRRRQPGPVRAQELAHDRVPGRRPRGLDHLQDQRR